MSVRTEVAFTNAFVITPEQLVDAQKSVPIDSQGYIPRGVTELDDSFAHVVPTLTRLGGGAISMSFDRPFGFKWPIDAGWLEPASQRTAGIILAPNTERMHAWRAILDTPNRLTEEDVELFDDGIRFYAKYAARKLHAMGAPRTPQPIDQNS